MLEVRLAKCHRVTVGDARPGERRPGVPVTVCPGSHQGVWYHPGRQAKYPSSDLPPPAAQNRASLLP